MAPSFDCGVSGLLCAEDNNSILSDNDCSEDVVGEFENTWHRRSHRIYHQDRAFDGGLLMQSEECLAMMVEKECHHLPKAAYFNRLKTGEVDFAERKEAINWIGKVHSHFGFGPLCEYLSINYLDRFLSAYELPKGRGAWMMQLLAVACVYLAVKMDESEIPISVDLQVSESKFIFEARTIQRMELLVLSTLKWRMQAITPFSFTDHFLYKINNDETPSTSLILKSIQLILSTIKGIDFLEFRPSEIAAAVAIAVVGEIRTVVSEEAISLLSQLVRQERVMKCIENIYEMSLMGKEASGRILPSVPQSPIGVLEAAACLSYRSDDTTAAGSGANSSQNSPDAKRRKLNTHCQHHQQ